MKPQVLDTFGAASLAIRQRQIDVFTWAVAEIQAKTAATSTPRTSPVASLNATVSAAAPSSMPCDGPDYPPCFVAQRESGNTYDAYNPTGCGGNGCYGRWQFSGAWAGKLGLPTDLSQATPEQQDEAARQLWNHGAGASNWGL